ncbi:ubiquitin-2 like Rad60 SUMO-like-domain-containing protein [Pyrenochaeta sp. MPI-SDFR-AT-0127]|nr:ubiquitin-2 like Rad60 SUMO-like-domain-containing protein [Pyrenochaeta sp. MPI-SDFR-AT-0127]
MTDNTQGASVPKKRSFFKRAAWQDVTKKEGQDMFSHTNEFKYIVAEQIRHRAEEERKTVLEQQHKQAEQHDGKRQKMLAERQAEPSLPRRSGGPASRSGTAVSKARSRKSLSPAPAYTSSSPPAGRYDSLVKSTSSSDMSTHKEALIIDLNDDEEANNDAQYTSNSFKDTSTLTIASCSGLRNRHMPPISSMRPPIHDDLEELLDPTLAALEAKARQRAVHRAQYAAIPPVNGEPSKAPIVQLLINPEILGANPLMVKVRIDSTIEKSRRAWCEKQGYSAEIAQNVFFTWKGTRVYDSTTIKRLGIQLDDKGNVSIEGDSNIYDDINLPKVVVEAWTEALLQQRKKEVAADAAVRKTAAEVVPVVEEDPKPALAPITTKVRLILKAKGKGEFRLSVNPESTFAHIAQAYKTKLSIDQNQPLTLTFDGDRLSPLDTIADTEIEDMDVIEVHFK